MTKKPTGTLNNISMGTICDTKEDIAGEVTALKLAVALIFRRMTKGAQDEMLIEMRQLKMKELNKVADELAQFQSK
ncbi:hypothetical protein AB7Y92_05945 [Providencia manganoxydans]|uniref:hypothetical protein n=1 Tax=Providencia manganoxydans TaxID=2923283 RepID=UPI0034E60C8F